MTPESVFPVDPLVREQQRLLDLLVEYTEKLRAIRTEAREIRISLPDQVRPGGNLVAQYNAELNPLRTRFARMQPPLTKLAQYGSQLVEHGAVDDVTRLELSLRVAELEAALTEAKDAVSANLK